MNYFGLRVYDIEESMVASGFPMLKAKPTSQEYEEEVINLKGNIYQYGFNNLYEVGKALTKEQLLELNEGKRKSIKHIKRACNLGNAPSGSGHDSACKGILISVCIEADQSFWLQWERYHYQDTISSMSTMHCLTKFDLDSNLFSKYTDQRIIDILKEKIEKYNNSPTLNNFHEVIHNCPEGIQLIRRVYTNYLQLKTMYNQRKHHKMYSWSQDFINMCNELPYFNELCLGGNN
ncbi:MULTISPECIES: hypothetical protein [unclassified Clostridium]|uniref:hypothetical protein n=1 Tax=unclassified Clostridium TaxID=2614128 RepID=UPI0020793EE9|nr:MULTISPECIES: hypothetical protein [unclassified Clostridium]